ncbi:hypothetical protein CLAFUW4_07956 [Fulvia fulva]|nr:hypothetical protein CLAFUR4_07961 [Fulvia fulva]WPV12735.1 hypothetical protein CLAFUW4_07956 [Fulvia fulva]WPV27273.1 hypothetical protein CLAFUW7_07957 [Fulvia fulva]
MSTVLFVDKDSNKRSRNVSTEPNLLDDRHWTDVAPEGSVVALQADGEDCGSGLGVVIDGRSRDVVGCGKICEEGEFVCFSKGLTSVGTGLDLRPWGVDVPLTIGNVIVKPGDIICADEAEQVVAVIPREKLVEVVEMLPRLKRADDQVLRDVADGVDLRTSFGEHRDHYTHFRRARERTWWAGVDVLERSWMRHLQGGSCWDDDGSPTPIFLMVASLSGWWVSRRARCCRYVRDDWWSVSLLTLLTRILPSHQVGPASIPYVAALHSPAHTRAE